MAWQKPQPELIARFDAALPRDPKVERRRMFGCPCAFVNGNMFTGVHERNLIVRLPETLRVALIDAGTAAPFAVMGRTMREYVAVDDAANQPPARLRELLAQAFAHTAGLPAKPARRKSSRQAETTKRAARSRTRARTKP